jgi:hypothetical protein
MIALDPRAFPTEIQEFTVIERGVPHPRLDIFYIIFNLK